MNGALTIYLIDIHNVCSTIAVEVSGKNSHVEYLLPVTFPAVMTGVDGKPEPLLK